MTHQIAPYGLRMPDDLKAELKVLATKDGRSMNNLIVRLLTDAVAENKTASNHTA